MNLGKSETLVQHYHGLLIFRHGYECLLGFQTAFYSFVDRFLLENKNKIARKKTSFYFDPCWRPTIQYLQSKIISFNKSYDFLAVINVTVLHILFNSIFLLRIVFKFNPNHGHKFFYFFVLN